MCDASQTTSSPLAMLRTAVARPAASSCLCPYIHIAMEPGADVDVLGEAAAKEACEAAGVPRHRSLAATPALPPPHPDRGQSARRRRHRIHTSVRTGRHRIHTVTLAALVVLALADGRVGPMPCVMR
eukprot:SAG25_NODE_1390_length_3142_cov_20.821043_4_plen_127_part_00